MKQLGNDRLFCNASYLMKMQWFHLENLTIERVGKQQSFVHIDEFWGAKDERGGWVFEGALVGIALLY